ncbi:DUF2849 domain-containing protein, partial [bacterium]|nr:DUF2849 domain-containing protein [bacterium]
PKVIAANALLEGDAIWFTEDNTWSRNIAEAELITDEAHGDIRLLEAKADQSIVVGVYLAEAKKTDNGPAPTHFREAFRTRGPSNYSHGKQEA